MLNTKRDIEDLFDELFPINRSITGEGYRKSLNILSRYIPFEIEKIASGTKVFDWVVPKEWVINDAYVLSPTGEKIIDYKRHNLEVMNYSAPVNREMELEELSDNLYSLPDHPDWIPYVTSYYKENWGFCLTHSKRERLEKGKYHAVIDSKFVDGFVEYGYTYLRSDKSRDSNRKTILLSSYLCHPSMANNELSGPIVLAALYDRISKWENRKYDYLFLVQPETIGSICFLYKHGQDLKKSLLGGLVLTCLGGDYQFLTYKKSRYGSSSIDKLFDQLAIDGECEVRKFDPTEGSDERQYCSSEFNLAVGQIAKTKYGSNPEYHTSADNKYFVKLERFLDTIVNLEDLLKLHELIEPLQRLEPYCEIQLGKRGLYPNINSPLSWNHSADNIMDARQQLTAISYILSYADKQHDLIDIAKISKLKLRDLTKIYELLVHHTVLK